MKQAMNALFLVRYDIGSNYLRDHAPEEQQGFVEHAKYMDLQHAAGTLILGGLLLNHVETCSITGGALLYRARSEKEARDIAMQDPAVRNSVFEIRDIKHWVPMIGSVSGTTAVEDIWSTELRAD